ncbi:MAG: hypothetical protein QHH19_05340, partial [Candidatus Thermoplasmatota archaeon]|nr:hypothetical protein [Candidatus Thermoplasmatota archaeon]
NTNTTNSKKKESPLFKIRTELAIGERIKDLVTRFLGQRIFFLTFQWLKDADDSSGRTPLIYTTYPKCVCTYWRTGC